MRIELHIRFIHSKVQYIATVYKNRDCHTTTSVNSYYTILLLKNTTPHKKKKYKGQFWIALHLSAWLMSWVLLYCNPSVNLSLKAM